MLDEFIKAKRDLAAAYCDQFKGSGLQFVVEPDNCESNYWLNAVICEDFKHRNSLLKATNDAGVMTRPIWRLMNHLPMYKNSRRGELENSEWLEQRIVNLPSGVPNF